MGLTVYSGINGVLGQATDTPGSQDPQLPTAAINSINKWDINHKSEVSEFASSATAQAMDRVAGNDDWDGGYGAYGDVPAFFPGDFFMMFGFLTESGTGPVSKFMSGRCIADEFMMKLDIEGAKEIEHEVKASCAFNGVAGNQLIPGNSENATFLDATYMNVLSASGCVVAVALPASTPAAQTWYVLKDVRTADLSLKTSNKNYHSSSTAIIDQSVTPNIWRNWSGRVRGNLDCTVNFSQYALPEELIPNKAILGVRIYTQPPAVSEFTAATGGLNYLQLNGTVTSTPPGIAITGTLSNLSASRYWEIDWIIFQAHSGIEVDRKTGNIIGATSNGGLKAVVNVGNVYLTGTSGVPTIGRILPPGAGAVGSSYPTVSSQWWPWTLPRTAS